MEICVHPYIPIILPTSSQCETLVVYPTIYELKIEMQVCCYSHTFLK